jgi:hypothetical protein
LWALNAVFLFNVRVPFAIENPMSRPEFFLLITLASFLVSCSKPSSSEVDASVNTKVNTSVEDSKTQSQPVFKAKGQNEALDVGTCFDSGTIPIESNLDIAVVDCEAPHTHQVYSRLLLDDDGYPGREALIEMADAHCIATWDIHIDPAAWHDNAGHQPTFPSEDSWNDEAGPDILCTYTRSPDGNDSHFEQLTGSVLSPP